MEKGSRNLINTGIFFLFKLNFYIFFYLLLFFLIYYHKYEISYFLHFKNICTIICYLIFFIENGVNFNTKLTGIYPT